MGDPAGIGPETIAGAWVDPAMHDAARLVVLGNADVLRRAVRLRKVDVRVDEIETPEAADSSSGSMPCVPCGPEAARDVLPGRIDSVAGQAAYEAVAAAAEWALAGRVDGMVTAPINKAALRKAGHEFPGHTELLAHLCSAPEVAMMLYLAPGRQVAGRVGLGVVHVTLHMAVRHVPDLVTTHAVLAKARLADRVFRTLLGDAASADPPRIAVAALNPHAGEEGLFGDEERLAIAPAVEEGKARGLRLTGPVPCDSLMVRAATGEFDAVVAMYHDQGHIALKLLDFRRAVNVTLGLPIVRVSVAHGTAFDRAWQGEAHCDGMVEAVSTCAALVRHDCMQESRS